MCVLTINFVVVFDIMHLYFVGNPV